MSGKGSKPRPYSVSQKQFASNWDNIFKKSTLQDRMQSEEELFSIHNNCGTDECCMQCDTAILPSAVDDAATVMAQSAAKKG